MTLCCVVVGMTRCLFRPICMPRDCHVPSIQLFQSFGLGRLGRQVESSPTIASSHNEYLAGHMRGTAIGSFDHHSFQATGTPGSSLENTMNRYPETAPAEDIPLAVTSQVVPETASTTLGTTSSRGSLQSRRSVESHQERRPDLHAHFDTLPGEPVVAIDEPVIDIEHVPVDDDPREWSNRKKVMCGIRLLCHEMLFC
jgi:hypothetical protein